MYTREAYYSKDNILRSSLSRERCCRDCGSLAKDGSRANVFLGSSYWGVACGRKA